MCRRHTSRDVGPDFGDGSGAVDLVVGNTIRLTVRPGHPPGVGETRARHGREQMVLPMVVHPTAEESGESRRSEVARTRELSAPMPSSTSATLRSSLWIARRKQPASTTLRFNSLQAADVPSTGRSRPSAAVVLVDVPNAFQAPLHAWQV